MAAPVADPIIGTTLGSFKITKVIGRGGMGTVYLGEHAVIGSRVAIKVLQERLASDESLVSRFYAEARAVNLIGHENIVNIFDMNVVPPNRYYLVMEFLDGKPLNWILTEPAPTEIAVPILLQVCDALQAAHDAGIVHRDLKPENIFLLRRNKTENFVKVLDFGLAKLLDDSRENQAHTAAGLIVGTPEFMSPEQANSVPVDGRSDIYSLGCIAWLLATGRLPFPQRGLTDLLVAHRSQNPKPAHEANPQVPRALGEAIVKAMQKRPEDRFQSARAFSAALESALHTSKAQLKPAVVSPAPPLASGPAASPVQARHAAKFQTVVTDLGGTSIGTLDCHDISRGGMFLHTTKVMPALFSRVKIVIPTEGNLAILGEVVRHVPIDQAKAWSMEPGFGVQFVDVTPPIRDAIARLVQPLPVQPRAQPLVGVQLSVASVILLYKERANGDHYEVLGLQRDVDIAGVRTKAREAVEQLEELQKKTNDPEQQQQIRAALARVKTAQEVLGSASDRARYDANRGNFRGIARCLLGGLGPNDLERIRQEFLTEHPTAAGSAHVKFLASKAYEARNQLKEALEVCEAALQMDPLNLQLHQRYALLSKKAKT
jgi:eukaryotic-like serine/threonine-protein kinase